MEPSRAEEKQSRVAQRRAAEMEPGSTLGNPFLEHQQQEQGGNTESIAGQVLNACTANYGRQRTLARLQSTRDGRDQHTRQQSNSERIRSRVGAIIVHVYHRFIQELHHLSLPAKAGLAGSICSLLCFAPGALRVFNKEATWGVVTVDVVLEANVGLTFMEGMNRTIGTLAAAALAVAVNLLSPVFGAHEPHFLVVSVFLSAFLATMFKFRPPFKDRWDLAVAWSMIQFHDLILSNFDGKEKTEVPIVLFSVIIFGFLTASLVNLSIAPKYAGTTINELVAKTFEKAGNVVERCVVAYCEGMELEQVQDHLSRNSEDENLHMTFNEILSTDDEVEKLMEALAYEPSHGKFFRGYPWEMYETILQSLKYALFDVVELDSCLHSEIQAPLHLRQLFEDEFLCIGKALAQVFHKLGESIREMKHTHSLDAMREAEEGALLLQHNIAKYTSSLISDPDALKSFDVVEENDTMSSEEPPIDRSDSSGSRRRHRLADGHQEFLQRQETMNRNWDSTVQRVAALSLIKFSALLMELVVKAKYVVTLVDELEHEARFEEDEEGNSRHPKPDKHQV